MAADDFPSSSELKDKFTTANFDKYKRFPTIANYKEVAKKTHAFFFKSTATLKIIGTIGVVLSIVLLASLTSSIMKLTRKKSRLFLYRVIWLLLGVGAVVVVCYKLDL